ncbi:hypothetical protein C8R46DRAFT_1192477 [Mycena filopes]|nr:hypothetical protein C8R46DRAFT_1192477 [Mycena filopes]
MAGRRRSKEVGKARRKQMLQTLRSLTRSTSAGSVLFETLSVLLRAARPYATRTTRLPTAECRIYL